MKWDPKAPFSAENHTEGDISPVISLLFHPGPFRAALFLGSFSSHFLPPPNSTFSSHTPKHKHTHRNDEFKRL
jgi:hypothetical protein